MKKPIALLWFKVISILFLGVSLFILVAGAPIYLLAMGMGGGHIIFIGFLIMLCLGITMGMQVITWIKLAKNSKNTYFFLKISWVCLSFSLLILLHILTSLSQITGIVFITLSIIIILTYQLFFSEEVRRYFEYTQNMDNNDTQFIK